MKDTALYIHIPFCISKCKYCDFTSYVCNDETKKEYIKSLIEELKLYSKDKSYNIRTVYIGGGTPSIMHSDDIKLIADTIYKSFETNIEEFTIECNTESITENKLIRYRECGINRISIGVQSFNDSILESLGRAHNSREARNAIILAKKYFHNVSVDLMTGLPNEREEDTINSIEQLIEYNIPHISLYSLIIEEGTPIEQDCVNNTISLPDEDIVVDRYDNMVSLMAREGINRYEISNFSKAGYECKHNMTYWRLGDYIGAGIGAHGYINRVRLANTVNLIDYNASISIGKKPLVEINRMNDRETKFEYIMLALRLIEGININHYKAEFNKDFHKEYMEQLQELEEYLDINNQYIRVKPQFLGILNSILIKFM